MQTEENFDKIQLDYNFRCRLRDELYDCFKKLAFRPKSLDRVDRMKEKTVAEIRQAILENTALRIDLHADGRFESWGAYLFMKVWGWSDMPASVRLAVMSGSGDRIGISDSWVDRVLIENHFSDLFPVAHLALKQHGLFDTPLLEDRFKSGVALALKMCSAHRSNCLVMELRPTLTSGGSIRAYQHLLEGIVDVLKMQEGQIYENPVMFGIESRLFKYCPHKNLIKSTHQLKACTKTYQLILELHDLAVKYQNTIRFYCHYKKVILTPTMSKHEFVKEFLDITNLKLHKKLTI